MIRLSDVTITHDRHPAVHHVSGVFAAGSLTAIVGPNGAGKTTLLRAIAGVHPPAAGRIEAGPLALLPQASRLDRGFPLSCLDAVSLAHARRAGPFRPIAAPARAVARDALAAVGLAGFEPRALDTLSAGQFQRLLFARLIVQDAPTLLFDEPFNAVDARTVADLLTLIRSWHHQGRTVVAVLHDLDQVRREFPSTLLLARHCVAWGPTAEVLTEAHLREARLAAEAWPENPQICRSAA